MPRSAIAFRVPVVGVPNAEGTRDRPPTRPWLQKRFIAPGATLGVARALIVIVIVSNLNALASESSIAGAFAEFGRTDGGPADAIAHEYLTDLCSAG